MRAESQDDLHQPEKEVEEGRNPVVISMWLLERTRGSQLNAHILFYFMRKCSIVIFLRNHFLVKSGTGGIFVGVSCFQEA